MNSLISIFLAITGAFLFGYAVFAFDPPTATPPGANVPAPLNVGTRQQDKAGTIRVDGLRVFVTSLFDGIIDVRGNIVDGGTTIYDTSTNKIPEAVLPFKKGDIISPGDRSLIDGLSGYLNQYFRVNFLGINEGASTASQVKCGRTFGPNNSIKGTYCQYGTCNTSTNICERNVRRVFVTSTSYRAKNLRGIGADIAQIDNKCQVAADNASLGGAWRAWISDASSSPSTRFNRTPDLPYQRLDGNTIAQSWSDLTDGRLSLPINIDEHGNPVGNPGTAGRVWTGTSTSGASFGAIACPWEYGGGVGWDGGDQDNDAEYGLNNQTNDWWTRRGRVDCPDFGHLYCFEQ